MLRVRAGVPMWLGNHVLTDEPKPFFDHLVELRSCLIRMVVAWLIATLVIIPFCPWIMELLRNPVAQAGLDPDQFLQPLRITSGMSMLFRVMFWGGIALSLPFLVYFGAQFVFPGLTARERGFIRRIAAGSVLLFALGVSMGYFVTLPLAVGVLIHLHEWLRAPLKFVELADYLGFALKLLLAFGLVFELPMILLALGMLGIVNSGALRTYRRHVIVGIFVIAMVLTPPDPLTQVLMALPMVGLYEVCIWIIRAREMKLRTRERYSSGG